MKKFVFVLLLTISSMGSATNHNHDEHGRESMLHDMKSVTGERFKIDEQKYLKFTKDLLNGEKIAIVNVNGMVCDFCARGIQKTFMKSRNVKKIDVDLGAGTILIAYLNEANINFEDIKEKITANGQTAIDMKIVQL